MLRILSVILFCAGIFCLAQSHAQVPLTGAGLGAPTSGVGCPAATTYLARVSGLSGTESTGMTTTICNMVTHGTYSLLDYWYQFATNTTATALINVPNSLYSGTANNAPTFTVDAGYTGNGSNAYIDLGFNPATAGGNWTLTCATIGYYGLTSRTTGGGTVTGETDNSHYAYISVFDAGPDIGSSINDGNFLDVSSSGANANGAWAAFRDNSSTTITFHHNGTLVASGASPSQTIPSRNIFALANNGNGTPSGAVTDQIAAVFGGCLTAAQVDSVQNDINGGIMTSLGKNVY